MSTPIQELPGFWASVDRLVYDPEQHTTPDRPHPFVYHITIHNDSNLTIRIRGRKWVIVESDGETTIVEGDGVVGKFPEIQPGQTFQYDSYHLIRSRCVANGCYFALTPSGDPVLTRIPTFEMIPP